MKLYKNICGVALGVALSLPLGCSEDFLEKNDTSNASESALFKKPSDGIFLVNAIYDTFHDVDFMLKAMWYQANFLTQDFRNWGSDTFFENYNVDAGFDPLNIFWTRSYQGIARANSAIPIVAKMKAEGVIDEALANRLTGEAYFLRGVFYYYLASNFGGVPLELQTVTDDGRHPRNSQDEVFAAVEADMMTAAGLLPWREDLASADLGRATKGAAIAYQGAAQMWLKKYAEAVTTFNQLEGKYQLMENFLDIHEYDKQNNKESIFEVQFLAGADNSWGHANETHWLSSFGMPEEVTTFGYHYAAKELYDAFVPGDLRRRATVIGPGEVHPSPAISINKYPKVISGYNDTDPAIKANYTGTDGKIINTVGTVARPWKGSNGNQPRSGYYSVKTWRDPNTTGATGTPENIFSGQNAIMMRLGEVLISKAEAQFRAGDISGAVTTLQRVRERGFGKLTTPSVVVPALSGTDLLKNILNEYRYELSGEFSVWFNLRRSGEHLNFVKEKYNKTVTPGKDIMPIPAKQIAINPTLEQNEAYK